MRRKLTFKLTRRESGSHKGRRTPTGFFAHAWVLLMCTFLCAAKAWGAYGGDSPSGLVASGNRLYREGKYADAEALYREAQKSLPESPEINFNLGNVAYRKGNYDEAEEHFRAAIESANATGELRKKALYNLGNCAFRNGEKLLDSDLQKALDNFKLSILRYHDVISREEYDRERGTETFKSDEDAKYNIEVARLRIKDILDKLKQQKEKRKEFKKEQEEFLKKLKEAIEKQEAIAKDTGDAGDRKQKGQDVSASVEDLTKRQKENKSRTNELAQELQQKIEAAKAQAGEGKGPPSSLDEKAAAAQEALKEAEIEQGTAMEHLQKETLPEAKESEEAALRDLQDALAKLTEPEPSGGQPGQQPQEAEQAGKEQQQRKAQADQEQEKKGQGEKKMTSQEAQEELARLRKQSSEMRSRNLQEFQRRRPDYRRGRVEYEPVKKDW